MIPVVSRVVSRSALRPGLSALIADGSPHARAFIRRALREAGIARTDEVEDGAAAVDALGACPPDLLVLDWSVGVIPAREVVRLARDAAGPALPIIVTMAEPTRRAVDAAVAEGIGSVLAKPLSAGRIAGRVRLALAQ